MERIAQFLDDLDDLLYALRLCGERMRQAFSTVLRIILLFGLQVGGVFLALLHPPLALASAILLFVFLMYRGVTAAHRPLEIA